METSERQALQHVVARLRDRFPHLAPEVLEAEVESAYQQFHESRVRSFLPVLVEREVIERCRTAPRLGDATLSDA